MNGNSAYYVNRNGYSSIAQDNIDDRATQSQRPSHQSSAHPLSRHEIFREEGQHTTGSLETTAQAYYFASPLGRSQPEVPPPGALSCGCWEYMPIGQHDPQNHSARLSGESVQEIVNAQAALERVADCVCQSMGWEPGWHSRWIHGRPGKGHEFQIPIRTSTRRKRETDVQDEGEAVEGNSAGEQREQAK